MTVRELVTAPGRIARWWVACWQARRRAAADWRDGVGLDEWIASLRVRRRGEIRSRPRRRPA